MLIVLEVLSYISTATAPDPYVAVSYTHLDVYKRQGQDGAGKTSLAEAMLHVSGRTPRMGTTHDGKSYLDYDDEEIRRKFTIGTSIAPIPYKDYKINLLDTSGHPDFIGDTLATCLLYTSRCV